MYKILIAVNAVAPFHYRIADDQVFVHHRIDGSATISREDGSFGFSLIKFDPGFDAFSKKAMAEIERVKNTNGLFTRSFNEDNLTHFSAIPWVGFTLLSHARSFAFRDSCPKISFGKMTIAQNEKRTIPMSVHVHHALLDGFHVGQFVDFFQHEMNK